MMFLVTIMILVVIIMILVVIIQGSYTYIAIKFLTFLQLFKTTKSKISNLLVEC